MYSTDYFELDVVAVARDIAERIPGVTQVSLFGSRKYPGKIRSDLDLLVWGVSNSADLNAFRDSRQHLQPLDLWQEMGGMAISATNGSSLPVADVGAMRLYPHPDDAVIESLRMQRFRADINYAMTVIPPTGLVPLKADLYGIHRRHPGFFLPTLSETIDSLVSVISEGVQTLGRIRGDKTAMRGSGSLVTITNEYDFQNLIEILLAPVMSLSRESFVARCQGVERTVDFMVADGKVALECKYAKSRSEWGSQIKDAEGALDCYLSHPGIDVALGLLGVGFEGHISKSGTESWHSRRGDRVALLRIVPIPEVLRHKPA
jgi:hypothetical protein